MGKFYETIEGYADMTAEQKLEALEALEPDETEVKRWKAQFDKASHEAAESKKQIKSLQDQLNSKLTADEQAEAERKQALENIIAERDALRRESATSKLASKYIAMGYTEEMASATAEAMLDNDMDTVIANQMEYNKGLEQALRTKIVQGNPTPDTKGGTPPKMTKADILAITDRSKRQKAIAENIELFS